MYMIKQLKLPPPPGLSSWVKSVAKKSPSHVLYYAPVRSLKKKCTVSQLKCILGQRSKMARQAAATLLLLKYKYSRSFLL